MKTRDPIAVIRVPEWLLRLKRHPSGLAGGVIVLGVIFVALLSPLISPYPPNTIYSADRFSPPSQKYLLGTDHLGRDVLSRVLWGARVSINVGVISVSIALALGLVIGMVSGYYRGKTDEVLMRVMDTLQSFPSIFLALFIVTVIGTGIDKLMIAIGLVFTPQFARLTRGTVLSVREKDYITAAVASGDSEFRIMVAEVLPNSISPIIVQSTISYAVAILFEAALSFLGLGIQPPTPSWGSMLSETREFMVSAPWMTIAPGLAIMVTVLGLNLLGDALRDVLDPRMRTG